MNVFKSIDELLRVLEREKLLLRQMFQKRPSTSLKYDYALELTEYKEERIKYLIDYGLIRDSGIPTYLIRLMNHFHEEIDEQANKYYLLDEFINYKTDIEYPLPMIYQIGYLTIKGYDKDPNLFLLYFPNNEVKIGFLTMDATNYLQYRMPLESWMVKAVLALKWEQLEEFRKMQTSFLASIPYTIRRKESEPERERYFHYTFYWMARQRKPCNKLKRRGYARPYEADARWVVKIGVSFSSKTGMIEEWKTRIERYEIVKFSWTKAIFSCTVRDKGTR